MTTLLFFNRIAIRHEINYHQLFKLTSPRPTLRGPILPAPFLPSRRAATALFCLRWGVSVWALISNSGTSFCVLARRWQGAKTGVQRPAAPRRPRYSCVIAARHCHRCLDIFDASLYLPHYTINLCNHSVCWISLYEIWKYTLENLVNGRVHTNYFS